MLHILCSSTSKGSQDKRTKYENIFRRRWNIWGLFKKNGIGCVVWVMGKRGISRLRYSLTWYLASI